jgi:hypothetical protein
MRCYMPRLACRSLGGWLRLFCVAVPLLLIVACAHEPNVTEIEYPGTEGGRIYFLTQTDGANEDNAELVGDLYVVDGCLQIGDPAPAGQRWTIVWPEGFGIAVDGDAVMIIDADQRVVTRVGERTMLGGSGAEKDERQGGCEGPFWYAGPDVYAGDAIPMPAI